MLSLGKLAPGQQAYYLNAVASGAEEYYTGAKESPGQWVGAGAEALGLDGEVDAEVLGRVLEHQHPNGTHKLTAARSAPVVAGFDATFCAPKSVSLLYALGDREVSNEVRNAADAAVTSSLEVLERAACRVRRGQGGHTVLDADGFVAAAFRHRTSRAADPHLHTHVVIGNLAHASVDQKWSALDGRPLYSWLSAVGHLHDAQLRWELTARLGVQWGPVRNGVADIAGIPSAAIREFSTRRREMEAHLEKYGQHGARAAQLAAYATRRPKDTTVDAEGLLPVWQARAEAVGLDAGVLAAVIDRASVIEPPARGTPEADSLYRWLASAEGLTARVSSFGERDVIKAVCNALPYGGRVDQVLDLVEGFLVSEHVIALRPVRDAATIRLHDGTTVAARTDEGRWTTPEMLEAELSLIDMAVCGQGAGVGVANPAAIDVALSDRPSLSAEQVRMVGAICSAGDRVELVEGVAGAGKTYALAAARQAWETSGYRVIGCSLAARAARQLEADAGIPSFTIDRLLADLDRPTSAGLDATTVIVVDEAGMVGTRKLLRLLDYTGPAGAKVVLVGDPGQLPEIDAGGAFRGLRARTGVSVLTDNRRQTEPWERVALAELRHGDTDLAIDSYLDHERVHIAATNDDVRHGIVEDWINAHLDGEDVLMVAAHLSDVDELNRRARTTLQDEGYLGPDRVAFGARGFADGDRVLALRNDYRLGVLNGTRGAIDDIDRRARTLHLTLDDGGRVTVPFSYAEAGHLTHGYATTIHKAQGITVARCLVLLDDTSAREHTYTALSRGRLSNDVYLIRSDHRVEDRHATELEPDGVDALRTVASRSAGKQLAIDQADTGDGTLDDLRRERGQLASQLGTGPPDVSYDYERLQKRHRQAQNYRDGAAWRRDRALEELDRLGPIRRHTHRAQRRELDTRISEFVDQVAEHDAELSRLASAIGDLIGPMLDRSTWNTQHATELDRLSTLDRQIDLQQRLDRFQHLERTNELERGLEQGMDLGW